MPSLDNAETRVTYISLTRFSFLASQPRGVCSFNVHCVRPTSLTLAYACAFTQGKDVWDKTGQFCAVFSPERPIGLPSVLALQQYYHLPYVDPPRARALLSEATQTHAGCVL
jgi:hypothetical protein